MRDKYRAIDGRSALPVGDVYLGTGGRVNLCIALTLYLLERLPGSEVAVETARILECTAVRCAPKSRC